MKTKSNSESVVRARHRTALGAAPGLVAAGLALTLGLLWLAHPSSAPVMDWRLLRCGWLAGLVATGFGAAALWRARQRTLLHSAAEIDAALATHNRLETATALHDAQDAMAKAQRAETEQFLGKAALPRSRRWLSRLGVMVGVAGGGASGHADLLGATGASGRRTGEAGSASGRGEKSGAGRADGEH